MAKFNRKDKENQQGEKHSLTSFEKKRGEKIGFAAKNREKKIYRVANVQRNNGETSHANHFDNTADISDSSEKTKSVKNTANRVFGNEHSYQRTESRNPQTSQRSKNTVSEPEKDITPEMAERMKRASFLNRQNNAKITMNTITESLSDTKHSHEKISAKNFGNVSSANVSGEKKPYENKYVSRTSDNILSEQKKVINPEMAERMKRAAYLDKLNTDKIKTNTARAETSAVSDNTENHSHSAVSAPHSGCEDKKPYEHKYVSETADSVIPEAKKTITPEMAERMKRAAFIEQKNAEAIRLSRAAVVTEAEDVPVEHSENREQAEENLSDVPVEHLEETEEKSPTSSYLGNSEHAVFDTYNSDVRTYRAKKAYSKFADKSRKDSENGIDRIEDNVRIIGELQRGEIGKIIGDAVVGAVVSENTRKVFNDAGNIVQSVQSSDSVGSTVLDVSSTLAAVEAKKMVKKLAETDLKKQKRVDERMKNHGNRFGIGSNYKDEVEKDKNEKIKNNGGKSERSDKAAAEKQGSSKVGNSYKLREEKQEYAKKQKSKEIKGKKRSIFVKEEKKNGNVIFGGAKDIIRRQVKKKSASLIIGAGGTVFTVVFGVVLVVILISAFFSWITPFSYKLAEDKEETEVKEEKDEINAYCLMLQDYFYVTKAHYYLEYGAYANAYYNWESASGTATWGSYYDVILKPEIEKAVKAIQDNFSKTLSGMEKPDPSYVNSLAKQMAEEIRKVTEQIIKEGRKNYNKIIDALDDAYSEPKHIDFDPQNNLSPTHDEKNGSHDGNLDVEQYSGKIVDGTNGYDLASLNIPTELSAEELLSYVALANSLSLISEDKQNDETEETESIKNDDPEITPEEINKFFERTGYIKIEYKKETGECAGCTRKLMGSWTAGWQWEEYCPGGHSILSGQISCLSEEELLEAVMEEYKAKDAGLSEKDCKKLIDEYKKYIKKILAGESERKLGESNIAVPAGWYMAYVMSKGETPIPHGEWIPPQPINLGEDENEEANESVEEST